MTMAMVCIINQYGNRVSHQHGTDSPFGDLFCQYLDKNEILMRGACILLRGVQVEPNETPNSMRFGVGSNVIAFINLLLYFNLDDLIYQSWYPLFIVDESNGLLNEGGMATAINVAVGRGNVIKIVDEEEGQLLLA
jgi:hypothetical protein